MDTDHAFQTRVLPFPRWCLDSRDRLRFLSEVVTCPFDENTHSASPRMSRDSRRLLETNLVIQVRQWYYEVKTIWRDLASLLPLTAGEGFIQAVAFRWVGSSDNGVRPRAPGERAPLLKILSSGNAKRPSGMFHNRNFVGR